MKKTILIILIFSFSNIFSQNKSDLLSDAEKLYESGKYTESIDKLYDAEKIENINFEINIVLGNCYTKLSDYKNALLQYSNAISKNPNSARAFYNRGIVNKLLENYNDAIIDFNSCIDNDKDFKYISAFEERGFIYFIIKENYQSAINDFEKFIEYDNLKSDTYMYLGICYGRLNGSKKLNINKGIEYLTTAINLKNNNADYFYYRAYLYLDIFKNDKALIDLNKAIEINPNYSDAYFEKGNLYYRKKDYKNQIECYNKAIEIEPNSGKFYYWRGYAKLENSDFENACADFKKAIELNYEKAKAMENVCIKKGRTYFIKE